MANKQLADWIKSSEAKGYSEEQIRMNLTKQGYKQQDIDEAVRSSKKPFNKFISEKGRLFGILFYFVLISFFVPIIISIIASLVIPGRVADPQYYNPVMSIAPAAILFLLAALVAYLIIKRKLFSAMYIILVYNSIGFLVHAWIGSFMEIGLFTVYFLIALHSAVFGLLVFYMFLKINEKMILKVGIAFSCVLALIFSMNNTVNLVLRRLTEQMAKIAEQGQGASTGLMGLFNTNLANMQIGFALCLVFFNAAFVYYLYKNKQMKKLLMYLIPIVLFIIFCLILNGLAGMVMSR